MSVLFKMTYVKISNCKLLMDTRLTVYFPAQPQTWVSRHQKDQTILDFNKARDDRVAVASAGPYANHLHLTPDR